MLYSARIAVDPYAMQAEIDRSPEKLERLVAKLQTLPKWYGVIDGYSNHPAVDQKLYEMSDLVLLPFRDSHEDIRSTVRNDLDNFPRAFGMPSQ